MNELARLQGAVTIAQSALAAATRIAPALRQRAVERVAELEAGLVELKRQHAEQEAILAEMRPAWERAYRLATAISQRELTLASARSRLSQGG